MGASLIFSLLLCLLAIGKPLAAEPTEPVETTEPVELLRLPELWGVPVSPPVGTIRAVTFDAAGGIILLEDANQRVLQFDREGHFTGETGGFGFGDGSLRGATDISRAGFEIWVCDPLAARIVRYDTWLAPLTPWTGVLEQGVDLPFTRPASVARAFSGDAVVLEQDRAEAWLIDPEGRLVERIGAYGELDQGLLDPRRVEISPDGTIAVADPGNRTVFLFDKFGTARGRRPWTGDGDGPVTVAWLNDSLFAAGTEGLRLLDPRGRTIREWPAGVFGARIQDLACDGDRLAVAAGATVQLFQIVRPAGGE